MFYNAPIQISATDKEYPGGKIYKSLMTQGIKTEPVKTLDREGYQVFGLDAYCYTHLRFDKDRHRAVILMDTVTPLPTSKIRLFLVTATNSRKREPEYIEVLPPVDEDEHSMQRHFWFRDLKWFLSGRAFSIQLYTTVLGCEKTIPHKVLKDIFGIPLNNVVDRLRYVDQIEERLEWIKSACVKAASQYGSMQRNQRYAPELMRIQRHWRRTHIGPNVLWGSWDENKKFFLEDKSLSFHAYLFNELTHYIDNAGQSDDEPLTDPLIYTLMEGIQERLDRETGPKMAAHFHPEEWTVAKLRIYRQELISTRAVGRMDIWSDLPSVN